MIKIEPYSYIDESEIEYRCKELLSCPILTKEEIAEFSGLQNWKVEQYKRKYKNDAERLEAHTELLKNKENMTKELDGDFTLSYGKTPVYKEVIGKLPLGIMLLKQFPNAIKAVAKRTERGHLKYIETDGDYLNFKNIPEEEYRNALMRHLFEEGEDSPYQHRIAVAWNALASLELYIENHNQDLDESF